jgi:2-hydroxychromene-2-carboxylate isomerase
MMTRTIDFFFFYGSIHTYLSVMRIEKLAAAEGFTVQWRPFNLREILIEQNNTAFAGNKVRLNYNWRDIERRAARLQVPFAGRAPYPVDPVLLALRVGIVAAAEGWCASYTKATFRAWFLDKEIIGQANHVEKVLAALGRPTEQTAAQAMSTETDALIKAATDAARQRGIFGSPTFAVGSEIFWGDDRLEDALAQ